MKKRVAPKVAILSTGDQPNDSVLVLFNGVQYWMATRKQAGNPTMFRDLVQGFAQYLQDEEGVVDGVAPVVNVTLPLDFMTNGSMPEGYESELRWEEGATEEDWDCMDAQEWFNHHWVPLHGVEVEVEDAAS